MGIKNKDFYVTRSEEELSSIEKSSIYRWQVFFERMKRQIIKGNIKEKIDFMQYIMNTVVGSHRYLCRSRYYFDPICQVRVEADEKRLRRYSQKVEDGVFIFAGTPAYSTGGGQRSAQLAKNFVYEGKQVYYYYAQAFHTIPVHTEEILPYQHQSIFSVTLEEVMELAGKNALFIFEIPFQYFLPYLEEAHKRKIHTIYEHIDNWETELGRSFYQDRLFQEFLELAEIITVTSRNLTELLDRRTDKKIQYLPNAVDNCVFDVEKDFECPKDIVIASGDGRTVLYFGTLWGEWINWDLILRTTELCPDCSFNMIGGHDTAKESIITEKYDNIHFLGLKKQQELPAYLKYSDIAIIPFFTDSIGVYVSPIKIFEYLAMGTSVLSTALPDIASYPNTMVCDTPEEWEKVIHKRYDDKKGTADCHDFIEKNCWRARCKELLAFFA